jgi:hypothetical protein
MSESICSIELNREGLEFIARVTIKDSDQLEYKSGTLEDLLLQLISDLEGRIA